MFSVSCKDLFLRLLISRLWVRFLTALTMILKNLHDLLTSFLPTFLPLATDFHAGQGSRCEKESGT